MNVICHKSCHTDCRCTRGRHGPIVYATTKYDMIWDRVQLAPPWPDHICVGDLFEVGDSRQMDKEMFPDSDNSGLGVFTRVRGRVTIIFTSASTVRIKRTEVVGAQHEYRVDCGDDEDYVFAPTLDTLTPSIHSHPLSWFWRIQHSSQSPTHASDWDPYAHHFRLVPLRVLEVGDEVTFHYHWKKK